MIEYIGLALSNMWIAIFVSFFGLILAIYSVIVIWRFRRFSYRRHDVVIKEAGKMKKVYPKYTDKKISVAEIVIWNSGTKYINSADMTQERPLRIIGNGSEILDGGVMFSNHSSNAFSCNVDKKRNEMLINFDFVEREQGCVIKVVYTGEAAEVVLDAEIKGGKRLKLSKSIMEWLCGFPVIYNLVTSKIFSFIILFFSICMCPIAILQSANYNSIKNNLLNFPDTLGSRVIDLIIILLLVFFSCSVSIPFIFRIFTPRIPKSLRKQF